MRRSSCIFVVFLAATCLFLAFSATEIVRTRQLPLPAWLTKYRNDSGSKNYRAWNNVTLQALHKCMNEGNCHQNQEKVVLLASSEFADGVFNGVVGGEMIWGASIYNNLRKLGYTMLFSLEWDETVKNYQMFPDLVKVVIGHRTGECHSNTRCIKSKDNPRGIPAWKMFDLAYFPSHGDHEGATPLKGKWILSAVPDFKSKGESPIQYIGFSTEEECKKIPMVPFSQRSNRAWLLMKRLVYVHDHSFAWKRTWFATLTHDMNIKFFGAWNTERESDQVEDLEDIEDRAHGITNLGRHLPKARFFEEVGLSKVMIGVGNPFLSPSPFDALCMGVPFINPVLEWSKEDPQNRSLWFTQHQSLQSIDPPHVYHVYKRDFKGFAAALNSAMTTEIGRFTPPFMTAKAVQERLTTLVETDWRERAEQLLEETLNAHDGGYVFEL